MYQIFSTVSCVLKYMTLNHNKNKMNNNIKNYFHRQISLNGINYIVQYKVMHFFFVNDILNFKF